MCQLLTFCGYTHMVSKQYNIQVLGPVPVWWCLYMYGGFVHMANNIYTNDSANTYSNPRINFYANLRWIKWSSIILFNLFV